MKRILPVLLVLVLASLACSIPGLPLDPPVVEPPATELPPATEPPLIEPPLYTGPLPSGFAVAQDTSNLLFYTTDGVLTSSLSTSDLGYIGSSSLHVAAGTSAGLPPVVYFTWRDGPQLILNSGGSETVLVGTPDFFRLAGAEGSPYFAYSTVTYGGSGILTQLYLGTPATIGASLPVVNVDSPDFQGLKPLAIRMEAGLPTGVYFTGCQYGIGGDLVFDPCNRLTFHDLTSGVTTEILADGMNPSRLSPDQTWVAYGTPGATTQLAILNLVGGETITFPAWVDNDRGAGDGVFSPDNNHVAWMEGSGYRMDEPITFRSLVRLATTSGLMVAEYSSADFDAAAGFAVMYASPVGWLDNNSVLIQVGGLDYNNSALIRLDLSGNMTLLAQGSFTALTFP